MKWTKQAAVLIATTFIVGCGALFNSGPQMVQFTSSPDGADVWVNGTPRGKTPLSLGLAKNQSYTVLFKLDGHSDFGAELNKQISAGLVVLDVLGGLVPIVIDAATGSWYKLSANTLHGSLTKVDKPDGTLTPQQLTLVKMGVPVDRAVELTKQQ